MATHNVSRPVEDESISLLSGVPPMLSEGTKIFLAAAALYLGTAVAYAFGTLLAAHLMKSFQQALFASMMIVGLHMIAYSIMKKAFSTSEKYLFFTIGLLFSGFGAWMSFMSTGYNDNTPALLSGVLVFAAASALAGWRYRWLHPL